MTEWPVIVEHEAGARDRNGTNMDEPDEEARESDASRG
jgi:hypothetical protein